MVWGGTEVDGIKVLTYRSAIEDLGEVTADDGYHEEYPSKTRSIVSIEV